MKKSFLLSSVFLCVLFAGTSSHAQNVAAQTSPETTKPQSTQEVCPTISVSCPSEVGIGELIEFKAVMSGNPGVLPIYRWSVSVGEIVEGQGTPVIKVRTLDKSGKTITGTVQVDGLDTACARTASCSMSDYQRPSPAIRFESYSLDKLDEGNTKLERFAASLKEHPEVQGYLIGYRARRGRVEDALQAVGRAKEYLINKQGLEEGRIVTAYGGLKDRPTVDLWLVPRGAAIPNPGHAPNSKSPDRD